MGLACVDAGRRIGVYKMLHVAIIAGVGVSGRTQAAYGRVMAVSDIREAIGIGVLARQQKIGSAAHV